MKSQYVIGLSIAIFGGWFLWGQDEFGDTISIEFIAIIWMGIVSYLNQNDLSKLIIALTGRVDRLDGGGTDVTKNASPIGLTDFGEKLSKQVDAKKIAQDYAAEVKFARNATEYRIQEACATFAEKKLLSKLKTDERVSLEKIAYKEGIDIGKIMRVIGVEMRDIFLKERTKEAS